MEYSETNMKLNQQQLLVSERLICQYFNSTSKTYEGRNFGCEKQECRFYVSAYYVFHSKML